MFTCMCVCAGACACAEVRGHCWMSPLGKSPTIILRQVLSLDLSVSSSLSTGVTNMCWLFRNMGSGD